MTDIRIEIKVEGLTTQNLEHFDARPVYNKMVVYFDQEIGIQFETEGKHRGAGWAPLSPSYAAWKRQHGKSSKILHLHGTLRASYVRGAPGNIARVDATKLVFGSADHKAALHQYGTSRGLPSRVQLVPIPRDYEKLADAFVDELFKQGGLR